LNVNFLSKGEESTLVKDLKKYSWNYIFILPGAVLVFLFSYMPMVGILTAFKDYKVYEGLWSSAWVGFDNFFFLKDPYFWTTVKNTLYITIFKLIFGFPAPIVLALMINEVRHLRFKKFIQSTTYFPHFISWIVVAYVLQTILAMDTGIVNGVVHMFGFEQINFMSEPGYFRTLVVSSSIWKEIGWGTIIYLAAMAGVNPEQIEAALLDGAGKFTRIRYVILPAIMPTIMILFILQMPALLTAGYDQIYPLVNPANLSVSNVLDVYMIRLGLAESQYSVASALGLVLSIVNLGLVVIFNKIVKWVGQESIW
jgi:putative aldouronate transport system permease protein